MRLLYDEFRPGVKRALTAQLPGEASSRAEAGTSDFDVGGEMYAPEVTFRSLTIVYDAI